jgi:opine dehydrogenase
MVVVPATGHSFMARKCAPYLRDGQIVVLNPGRTGGALEFTKVLSESGCTAKVIVAEAQTLVFASRSTGPAQARVFRVKNAVPVAALPSSRTAEVLGVIREAYPEFIPAQSVLKTSLDNMGAIFHPALATLNAGRIESTSGQFQFYIEGVTPSVGRVLEAMDRERVTVAAALGVRAVSAREWLKTAYNAVGSNLHEAIRNNESYRGISAPGTLEHRYIREDVPMSLVPISELGRAFGVSTPVIDATIRLASTVHGTDYRAKGRSVESMGLNGMSIAEIKRYVNEGIT